MVSVWEGAAVWVMGFGKCTDGYYASERGVTEGAHGDGQGQGWGRGVRGDREQHVSAGDRADARQGGAGGGVRPAARAGGADWQEVWRPADLLGLRRDAGQGTD